MILFLALSLGKLYNKNVPNATVVEIKMIIAESGGNMRTRYLTQLTNYEVEQYLQHSDLIYIPVGTVELHGSMPLNCEYVTAEALALEMAEQTDGLVLDGLQLFFPGATTIGRGTVYVSPQDGGAYLMQIAKSLLRQGFRRQVYVSMHGPSHMTISPMIAQFFTEERVPLLYIDVAQCMHQKVFPSLRSATPDQLAGLTRDDVIAMMQNPECLIFGAYGYLGKEEQIPLDLGIPDVPPHHGPLDQWIDDLNYAPTSAFTAWYYGEYADHGAVKKLTHEERSSLCSDQKKWITAIVNLLDVKKAVNSLAALDRYQQSEVFPRYGGDSYAGPEIRYPSHSDGFLLYCAGRSGCLHDQSVELCHCLRRWYHL